MCLFERVLVCVLNKSLFNCHQLQRNSIMNVFAIGLRASHKLTQCECYTLNGAFFNFIFMIIYFMRTATATTTMNDMRATSFVWMIMTKTKLRGLERTKSFVERVIGADHHVHGPNELNKTAFFSPFSPLSLLYHGVEMTIQR